LQLKKNFEKIVTSQKLKL